MCVCLFVGSNVKQNKATPWQLFVPHFAALCKDDLVLLRSSHCLNRKCFSLHAVFAAFFQIVVDVWSFFLFLMGETDVYSRSSSADCSTKPVPAVSLWS